MIDNPATQHAYIECFGNNGTIIAPGASVVYAFVHYNIAPGAAAGSVTLNSNYAFMGDDNGNELGTCNHPNGAIPMDCPTTTINLVNLTLALDCNPVVSGVQSNCHVPTGTSSLDVELSLENISGAAIAINGFNIGAIHDSDTSRLAPVSTLPPDLFAFDGNPDFTQASFPTGSWDCSAAPPQADTGGDGATKALSRITCASSSLAQNIANHTRKPIAVVHYSVPAGAPAGPLTLNVSGSSVTDGGSADVGTCGPASSVPMACPPATITLYCKIMQADVNHNTIVNSTDLQQTATHFGQLPGPANYDQNFEGVINSTDLFLIAQQFGKRVSACP